MKRLLFACAALLVAVPPPPAADAAARYDDCMALVETDAAAARRMAIDWFTETGAPAAAHCEAAALSALGADASAANRLQEAAALPGLPAEARADMLTQAALIWRDLGRTAEALKAMDVAIAEAPDAARLVTRAELLEESGEPGAARAAFDAALDAYPGDPAIMAASAAARLRAGDAIGAQLEAEAAVTADDANPAAWLTLGLAERELGQKNQARRAWLRAIDLSPESETAIAARQALQDMDVGG